MNESKICPLLAVCAADVPAKCLGERCAWYAPPAIAHNGRTINEGRCAVQMLGLAAPELVNGVRRL